MDRDATLRASRRTARWQNMVKVAPIQRSMAKMAASKAFKTRKLSCIEQRQLAIKDYLELNWNRVTGDSTTTAFASAIIDLRYHGHVRRIPIIPDAGVRVLRGLGGDRAVYRRFAHWLSIHVDSLKSTQRRQMQSPTSLDKLSAGRLHLVGHGRIGKNFLPGAGRLSANQQAKSKLMAKKLFHYCFPHSANLLPAFILREALQTRRGQGWILLRSPTFLDPPDREVFAVDGRTSPTGTICHFFRLPAELRNAIYELALAYDGETDSSGEVNLLAASSPTPALPLTCKKIGEECGLMYLANFRQFWSASRFYIDASALPSGFHTRHILLQLPEREIGRIKTLRVAFVARNGVYNAVLNEDHWTIQRVGGPCPSGRGVRGRRVWGSDEVAMVYRKPVQLYPVGHLRPEYELRVVDASRTSSLALHMTCIRTAQRERIGIRGQIAAIIEELNMWL